MASYTHEKAVAQVPDQRMDFSMRLVTCIVQFTRNKIRLATRFPERKRRKRPSAFARKSQGRKKQKKTKKFEMRKLRMIANIYVAPSRQSSQKQTRFFRWHHEKDKVEEHEKLRRVFCAA